MNCPFEATLYYHKKANHWKFVVKNSSHNHHPSGSAAAHTANRKLSARLYQEMNQLSDAGLKPARILEALKRLHQDEMILATITTIYSARNKTAAQSLRSLNPIIQLHKALPQSDYTTRTKVDKSGEIKGLFFCHNLSVQLLTHYHHIILLDCTYMTNKHKMPLLHNTSFSAAFCFLAEETQDFYDWALETFLTIFTSNNIPLPKVFLTDREQALINSIQTNFPDSHHLLCTWHIMGNLTSKANDLIKDKKKEVDMIRHWGNVIRISTTGDFCASFSRFAVAYGEPFQKYMNSTWLPVAEKYSNAWTKNVPHFDHRVTSRIESSHAYIKSHLRGPNYCSTAVIKSITSAILSQAHEISAHYHQQKINALRSIGPIFSNCLGRITHYALRKAQNNLVSSAQLDKSSRCNGDHHLRTGIPCQHRIAALVRRGEKVDPDEFHAQWHIKVHVFFFTFFYCPFWRRGLGVVGQFFGCWGGVVWLICAATCNPAGVVRLIPHPRGPNLGVGPSTPTHNSTLGVGTLFNQLFWVSSVQILTKALFPCFKQDFRPMDQPKSADDVQKVEEIKEKLLEMNPSQRALQIDAINRIIEGSGAIVDVKLPKGGKKKQGRGRPRGAPNKPKK